MFHIYFSLSDYSFKGSVSRDLCVSLEAAEWFHILPKQRQNLLKVAHTEVENERRGSKKKAYTYIYVQFVHSSGMIFATITN